MGSEKSNSKSRLGRKTQKTQPQKNQPLYTTKKGLLYFNENQDEKGWGDGGIFARLKGAPELGASDLTLV